MENQQTPKFLVIYQNPNYELDITPVQVNEFTRQHVDHVRKLDSNGILFLCGPLVNQEKGMLILNAKTYEEADSYVKKDPFIANNCYKNYIINKIQEANAENNYLLEFYLSM